MENSDDQFSLKWNNFQSNLATGFHDLLQEEDMVDVTLAAEGKFLQAHKIILSVCSPYFKDLFKVNPCKHPIVILKDVGHQELADMLDFMYRGEASVRQEDLAAFLKLAETLKVKGLAGDKSADDVAPTHSPRKPLAAKKKVKILEKPAFDSEDDPGDPEFNPGGLGSEPKRKRKRMSSPQPKTDSQLTSLSANTTHTSSNNTNTYLGTINPKQEVPDSEDVEFLDESANDPLVQFITSGTSVKAAKDTDDGEGYDDSNLDAGDDHHYDGDMDMTPGPSNADDSTDQVPQGYDEEENLKKPKIWEFYQRSNDKEKAKCRSCSRILKTPKSSTRSLHRHLQSYHVEDWQSFEYKRTRFQNRLNDLMKYVFEDGEEETVEDVC